MTDPRRYMYRLRDLDRMIVYKEGKIRQLEATDRTYTHGIDYSADRVQTSPTGEGFTRESDWIVDQTARLRDDVRRHRAEYVSKIKILDEMRADHAILLRMRYLDDYYFEEIADTLGRSTDRVRHMHGEALAELAEKIAHFSTL